MTAISFTLTTKGNPIATDNIYPITTPDPEDIMAEFIIATASTSDLDLTWLTQHDVPFIPYTYLLDEKDYYDDCRAETKKNIFTAMRAGKMPSTSQIPEEEYIKFFTRLLDTGKDIIFLDMSRAISNSYNNAVSAEKKLKEKYPDRKFTMIDTRCITGGLALLVTLVVRLKESGASYEECVRFAEENKLHVIHHFVVDDLKWLRKGGRLSNASAIIGTLLNIKPILYVTDEGTLVASSKVRGRKTCLANVVKGMAKDLGDPDGKEIFIFHADCEGEANAMADKMRELYPTLGKISIFWEGPTIGAHVGPGFIGVFYLGTKRTF